jgi:hypothetical protein
VTAPWAVGDRLWVVVTVLTLIASVLLVVSLIRNPALPTGGRSVSLPETTLGV